VVAPRLKGDYYDVVDGQQRLTTLMILLCVIRDMYPNINDKVDARANPSVVKSKRLLACISDDDERKRLKLCTHHRDMNDFEEVVVDNTHFGTVQKPNKNELRLGPRYRFINTVFLFRNRLEEIGGKEAGHLLSYLFNQVKLIRIECKSRAFAIKLFQVLNNRGLDLTSADLIKSYLLAKLPDHRQGQFIADWQVVEQMAKDADSDLNDLFTLYQYYLLATNPKKSLYEELEKVFESKVFEGKDSNDIIRDFKRFVHLYKTEIYHKNDKVIYSFWYLRWTSYWKSIMLAALQTGYADYDRLTVALRRFYYLYWIAGKNLNHIKQISFNLIKWVKEGVPVASIEAELEQKIAEERIINLVLEVLEGDIYWEPWLKALLVLLEYQQTDDSNPSFIWIDQSIHVEHIIPQGLRSFPEWNHISDEMAEKYMHSGANLTLLSGKKNIEASNNPFQTKITIYQGKGKYSDRNGGVTAFHITQKIVNDFERGRFASQWNQDAIEDRWKWFFGQVTRLLNIQPLAAQAIDLAPEQAPVLVT
jgi:uncharacterized protein with ParB-like and HNH nuclease domain